MAYGKSPVSVSVPAHDFKMQGQLSNSPNYEVSFSSPLSLIGQILVISIPDCLLVVESRQTVKTSPNGFGSGVEEMKTIEVKWIRA
jgi:hypothetical protein